MADIIFNQKWSQALDQMFNNYFTTVSKLDKMFNEMYQNENLR